MGLHEEISGMLCSDHQVMRVFTNKIMPAIIDATSIRLSGYGDIIPTTEAINTIMIALAFCVRGDISSLVESGLYTVETLPVEWVQLAVTLDVDLDELDY